MGGEVEVEEWKKGEREDRREKGGSEGEGDWRQFALQNGANSNRCALALALARTNSFPTDTSKRQSSKSRLSPLSQERGVSERARDREALKREGP